MVPEKTAGREYRISTEDEIDLMEIFFFFWDRKATIAKVTVLFFALGILVVIFSRVEYEASATLLPETQSTQASTSNLLRQYGGMLGISGAGQVSGGGGISTGLYPDIISSLPYQVELMNEPVYFSSLDMTMTPQEYFINVYPPSVLDYVEKYTLGLPSQIIALFKNREGGETSPPISKINRDSVVSLSSSQRSAASKLESRINLSQDEGLITLTVELPDRRASAELGRAGIELLKEYVREYRTQKVNKELGFVREQVNEAKKRFEEAQMKLAEFRDSNVNLATAKAQTREQELQSQYDLAFDLYNSLVQNLEQTKLKVQEETPVFTTIEPFQIPTSNSKPNTILILGGAIFLGLFIGVIYVIIHKIWSVLQWQIYQRENQIVK